MKRWHIRLLAAVIGIVILALILWQLVFSGAPIRESKPSGVGFIDKPTAEILLHPVIDLSGWALDPSGIDKVEAVLDGKTHFPLRFGIARPDVGQIHPGFPDSSQAGFEGTLDLGSRIFAWHKLTIEVINRRGQRTLIGKKTIVAAQAPLPPIANPAPAQSFFILMASSGIGRGGANEIKALYEPLVSSTVKVGMRVPILYLRTTGGREKDWVFDPDFDLSRQCENRSIADDSLNQVIDYAVANQLPVLFTLNGGVWADSGCDIPEWDINDALERDATNCQWNENDEVFPDDYLQNLPGSVAGPQVARTLSLNVYASDVRKYKKRNLQQAGKIIRQFALKYPHLFVGVNLDPDVYMNPFFESPKHWHDYNPQTLRQFREWLAGSGVYAGKGGAGLPDLSVYRRRNPLSLAQVNALSGKAWHSWDEVDPPRAFPTKLKPFWENAWAREWELFRRHLVSLHYDELSEWLAETGIETRFIFSSQGFSAPLDNIMPFAVRLDSPVKNYDSGGMTVEGALPKHGHLGAILYGDSSLNKIRMEGTRSLFSVFRQMDSDWAVVEHNTADFHTPAVLPGFAAGYRSLREMFNHGARFFSPMAWNGSNGLGVGQAGFASFTAFRNTPLEDATRDFMISHANFPRGGRLWTFGASSHEDRDGWTAETGEMRPGHGVLALAPNRAGREVTILSPVELGVVPSGFEHLFIRGRGTEHITEIEIRGLDRKTGRWLVLQARQAIAGEQGSAEEIRIPLDRENDSEIERLRITMKLDSAAAGFDLRRIGLWPRLEQAGSPPR